MARLIGLYELEAKFDFKKFIRYLPGKSDSDVVSTEFSTLDVDS